MKQKEINDVKKKTEYSWAIFVSIFLLTKKKTARKQDYGKGDGQDSEKADSLNEGKEKAQEMESFLEKQPDSPSDGLRRDSPIGSAATWARDYCQLKMNEN